MVHANGRDAECAGKAVRSRGTNQQRASQSRPLGVGDGGELLQSAIRPLEQAAGQRQQAPDVIARGELRHHAAVFGMQR